MNKHSSLLTPHSSLRIDLVYTWINVADKKWQDKKHRAMIKVGKTPGTRAARFDADEELMYSLRSVHKFAPWINKIFIIIDGKSAPAWMKKNPKIVIVDHSDFIPKKYLPTFNSIAIETFLHLIPGLSEHFLYANDDFFFGAHVLPDFFFDAAGNPIVITKEKNQSRALCDSYMNKKMKSGVYKQQMARAARIVYDNYGALYNITLKHAIEPMRKSYMADTFNKLGTAFVRNNATAFRESQNVPRIIFPMMDNANGRNTLVLNWRTTHRRIVYDVKNDFGLRRTWHMELWLIATVLGFIKYDLLDKFPSLIPFYKPALFCINDADAFRRNKKWIHKMFEERAPWEK